MIEVVVEQETMLEYTDVIFRQVQNGIIVIDIILIAFMIKGTKEIESTIEINMNIEAEIEVDRHEKGVIVEEEEAHLGIGILFSL